MASTQSLGPVVVSFSRLDSKRGMLLLVALLQFTKAKSTLASAWRHVGVKTFRTFLQPWTAVCKEPLFHFVNAGVDFGALQYRIILSEYLNQLGGCF